MPKSKRSKPVSLTQVKRKTKSIKERVIKKVEKNVTAFKNTFLLKLTNLNNHVQSSLRQNLTGEFVFGKKQIIRIFFKQNASKNPLYE